MNFNIKDCFFFSVVHQLILKHLDLALQVFDFIQTFEFEIFAQRCKVLDGLLVFFTLTDQLLLIALDLLLVLADTVTLPGILLLPHLFSLFVVLGRSIVYKGNLGQS